MIKLPKRSTLHFGHRAGLMSLDLIQRAACNCAGICAVIVVAAPLMAFHFAPKSERLDKMSMVFTQFWWDVMDEIEAAEQGMLSDRWLEWIFKAPANQLKPVPPPFVHNDSGIDLTMMAVEHRELVV